MNSFAIKDIMLPAHKYIPGFCLRRGEIALIECDFILGEKSFDCLIDNLLKEHIFFKAGFADYCHYYQKFKLKLIVPKRINAFLVKFFNLTHEQATEILNCNNIEINRRWNSIPATLRNLLALDATSKTYDVIVFTSAGLDPIGVRKLYLNVAEIARKKNNAFIHIECNRRTLKTTIFPTPLPWLEQFESERSEGALGASI